MLALELDSSCSDPSSLKLLEPPCPLMQNGDADNSGHSPVRAAGGTTEVMDTGRLAGDQ